MKLSTSKVKKKQNDTCHLCVYDRHWFVQAHSQKAWLVPGALDTLLWKQEVAYPYLEWEQKVIPKERLRVGKVFWTEKFSLMLSILFEIFTWAWVAATLNSKVLWVLASFCRFPQKFHLLLNFWLFLFLVFFVNFFLFIYFMHTELYIYYSYICTFKL